MNQQHPARRTITLPAKPQTAKPHPAAQPPHPLAVFVGKRIAVQRGPNTYVGLLTAITNRWLIFAEATVTGSSKTVQPPGELFVSADSISHVHLETPVGVPSC